MIVILLFFSLKLIMGGNALKNINTVRLDKEKYLHLKTQITEALLQKKIKICDLLETPGKETFGDLDLLFCSEPEINIHEIVKTLFEPKEIVSNGEVVSFDYKNFQVDLIKCKNDQQMKMARFYLSYGDFGSIIGRITNFYGIKFGHHGLFVNLFQSTILNKDSSQNECSPFKIILSQDPQKICEFLELDYQLYNNGFKNTRDIFEFISSSSFFKKEMFNDLNRSYKKREQIRPMFQEFLAFLDLSKESNLFSIQNQQLLAINFIEKQDELKDIRLKLEKETIIKNKFNAGLFIKYGWSGKKLGEAMVIFKKKMEEKHQKDFNQFVYDSSIDLIQDEIKHYVQN